MRVYMIENSVNGLKYVGATRSAMSKRWSNHCRAGDKTLFSSTIQKFGRKNFKVTILEECSSIEQMHERERYWIKQIDTIYPNGYNLEDGGVHNKHTHELSKQKMSRTMTGENNPMYGKIPPNVEQLRQLNTGRVVSDETRDILRKQKLGKPRSEATKAKIRATLLARNQAQSKEEE